MNPLDPHAKPVLPGDGEALLAMFENAGVAIGKVALDGRFLMVNEAYATLTGYSRQELLSGDFQRITHPEDVGQDVALAEELLLAKVGRYSMEKRYVCKDGASIWVNLNVSLVSDEAGEPQFFVAVAEPIDGRRNAEDALSAEQLREQIDAIQDVLHTSRVGAEGMMASALAHELNQPLTAITNYLSAAVTLLRKEPVGQAERAIPIIEAASASAIKASEIIRRLRTMLTGGRPETQPVQLRGLVEEAAGAALAAAAAEGIEFEAEVGEEIVVGVDPVQIQQVLTNLILNSVEALHGRPERRISVTAKKAGQVAELCVSDTGPGMAQSVRERLFQPFVSTKPTGMGVGLSICRAIVEAHGCTIRVPEQEEGTSVFLTLPLAKD